MEQLTMDKALLDADVREYAELKAKADEIDAKLKEIKARIVDTMEGMQEKKYSNDEYSATISYKENIKYNDEIALIKLLKEDDTLKSYVVETINSKALNELIKKNDSVRTRLKESYSTTTSSALTIKKI